MCSSHLVNGSINDKTGLMGEGRSNRFCKITNLIVDFQFIVRMIMLGVVMPQSFSNIPKLCSKVCRYVLNVSYLVTIIGRFVCFCVC